jgi:hypothetical protein
MFTRRDVLGISFTCAVGGGLLVGGIFGVYNHRPHAWIASVVGYPLLIFFCVYTCAEEEPVRSYRHVHHWYHQSSEERPKMLNLETIAALRSAAENYEKQAANALAVAAAMQPEESAMVGDAWRGDAATFTTIATEYREIAEAAAKERAYENARWLTNRDNGLPMKDAKPLIDIIRGTAAVLEYRVSGVFGENDESRWYRIRLVNYFDPQMGEWRWAVEYTTNISTPGISDTAERADAEYRYWEAAVSMGAVKS